MHLNNTSNSLSHPVVKSHYMTRLSHYAMDMKQSTNSAAAEFYEEKIPDDEFNYIYIQQPRILELSKQIILRI